MLSPVNPISGRWFFAKKPVRAGARYTSTSPLSSPGAEKCELINPTLFVINARSVARFLSSNDGYCLLSPARFRAHSMHMTNWLLIALFGHESMSVLNNESAPMLLRHQVSHSPQIKIQYEKQLGANTMKCRRVKSSKMRARV